MTLIAVLWSVLCVDLWLYVICLKKCSGSVLIENNNMDFFNIVLHGPGVVNFYL